MKQNERNKMTGWWLIWAVCSGLLDMAQLSRALSATKAGKQPVLTRRSDAGTQRSYQPNQQQIKDSLGKPHGDFGRAV